MKHNKKTLKKNSPLGSIRIIAGKHGGRKLPVLMAEGLRPTTDRVKETVFNWLMPYIQNSVCLDCFSGSGGLGFEALSRGAKQVTLIELNKQACKLLQQNQQLLKADNVKVIQGDCLQLLTKKTPVDQGVDVVFLDPPFRKSLIEEVANLLNNGWLNEHAVIYVEMEINSSSQLPSNWQLLKEKTAGQVNYCLYQATV